jgi:hypothetical protein
VSLFTHLRQKANRFKSLRIRKMFLVSMKHEDIQHDMATCLQDGIVWYFVVRYGMVLYGMVWFLFCPCIIHMTSDLSYIIHSVVLHPYFTNNLTYTIHNIFLCYIHYKTLPHPDKSNVDVFTCNDERVSVHCKK